MKTAKTVSPGARKAGGAAAPEVLPKAAAKASKVAPKAKKASPGALAAAVAVRRPAKAKANTRAAETAASLGGATAYSPAEIEAIFSRFQAADPDPRSELVYSNPFTLLVAVVLSAQATDAGVNKATRGLFAEADTPAAMLALGEDRVRDAIKTIGLFRNKAKNVVALSRILVERYGGEVPASRAALEELPGVGRKTANVVLNVAFGEPTIAVDTHIFRVANRILLAPGKTPDAVEEALERIVPPRFRQHAHHWLILHGRYTCVARRPLCERCIIADLCKSPEKVLAA